jgi:hypothetical protein
MDDEEELSNVDWNRMIPNDMPLSIEEVTVQTWKDGKGGYILFTPADCIMTPMRDMEVQSLIEYE